MKIGLQKIKITKTVFFVILIMAALCAPTGARYINTGALDVRLADNSQSEYITEYLAPGENAQRQIQISNFGPQPKEILLYSAETQIGSQGDYVTKQNRGSVRGISGWIDLPAERLTIQPAESAIIKVNISAPQNAGTGLHTGAVMVKEIPAGGPAAPMQFSIEKGIRVYLNVTGPVIPAAGLAAVTARETGGAYIFRPSVQNTGTTTDTRAFTASINHIDGRAIQSHTATIKTSPGETAATTLEIPKPEFGIYTLSLSGENGTLFTKTVAIIPLWALLSLVLGLIMYASWARKTTFCPLKIAHFLHYSRLLSHAANLGKSLEFQRSFAYIGLASIIMGVTFSQININPYDLKTQLLATPECSFDMTVKWGGLRKDPYPENHVQQWQGRINIPNSKISIVEFLHFEQGDQAELNKEKDTLYYNLQTGPDNDGIIIRVEPVQNEFPYIYHINDLTGEINEFPITDHITSEGVYPYRLGAVSFHADLCENSKIMQELVRSSGRHDLFEAYQLEATPDTISASPPGAVIPELENLFMAELPSTPDALSEVIMQSGYVQKISRINATRKIESDNILIRALAATPDILEEIAATPDLNFIFLPADTIVFPPLDFSFTRERVIRQSMGTIIFVQNKESPWNAFVGTTDFQLLSGDLRIPASSLSIDPGEPEIIGRYSIVEEEFKDEELPEEPLIEEEPLPPAEEAPILKEPAAEEEIVEEPAAEEEVIEEPAAEEEVIEEPAAEEEIVEEPAAEEEIVEEPAINSSISHHYAFHYLTFNLFRAITAHAAIPRIAASQNSPALFLSDTPAQEKTETVSRRLEIKPEMLEKIRAGEQRSFAGRFDKATLVNVDPSPGEKVIFILRPVLEIRIPAGMPAGTYRGELTITSL